jgi:hypothetical protein
MNICPHIICRQLTKRTQQGSCQNCADREKEYGNVRRESIDCQHLFRILILLCYFFYTTCIVNTFCTPCIYLCNYYFFVSFLLVISQSSAFSGSSIRNHCTNLPLWKQNFSICVNVSAYKRSTFVFHSCAAASH